MQDKLTNYNGNLLQNKVTPLKILIQDTSSKKRDAG